MCRMKESAVIYHFRNAYSELHQNGSRANKWTSWDAQKEREKKKLHSNYFSIDFQIQLIGLNRVDFFLHIYGLTIPSKNFQFIKFNPTTFWRMNISFRCYCCCCSFYFFSEFSDLNSVRNINNLFYPHTLVCTLFLIFRECLCISKQTTTTTKRK